jgi:hypothetical protein
MRNRTGEPRLKLRDLGGTCDFQDFLYRAFDSGKRTRNNQKTRFLLGGSGFFVAYQEPSKQLLRQVRVHRIWSVSWTFFSSLVQSQRDSVCRFPIFSSGILFISANNLIMLVMKPMFQRYEVILALDLYPCVSASASTGCLREQTDADINPERRNATEMKMS